MEVALGVTGFRSELWSALEETVFLHECEIYKYEPSSENDDESAGKLWSINLFFFHRKLKKMLLMSGEAISKLHMQNAHKHAYQQHARRRAAQAQQAGGAAGGSSSSSMGVDDADAFESDNDSDDGGRLHHAGGALSSAEQAQQDADDAAMEAAEDEMLEELAADNGERGNAQKQSGEIAGSYVDASLLESVPTVAGQLRSHAAHGARQVCSLLLWLACLLCSQMGAAT
jgi:hypothetical protein